MTNDAKRDLIEAKLFEGGEPTKADTEMLLTQYRLFVETSEALVSRRQSVNTFFLTVNSAILTVVGLLLRDGQFGDLESGALVVLGLGGVALCYVWCHLITSFRQLADGKFQVIYAFERRLPARVFTAEWEDALGCGKDPKVYTPFTGTEACMPCIFGVLQALLLVTGLCMLVQ